MGLEIFVIAVIVWIVGSIAAAVKASKPTYPPSTPLPTRPVTFGVPPEGAPYSPEQGGAPWPPPQPNAQAGVQPQQPWPQGPPGAQWPQPQVAPVNAEARWQPQTSATPEAPWMQRAGAQQAQGTAAYQPPAAQGAAPGWRPVETAPARPAMPAGFRNQPGEAPAQQAWAPQAQARRDTRGEQAALNPRALPQTPLSDSAGTRSFEAKEQALLLTEPDQPINAAMESSRAADSPLAAIFKQPNSLLSAFILHEVLGPPKCRAGSSGSGEPRELQA